MERLRVVAVCVGEEDAAVPKTPRDFIEVDEGGVVGDKHYGVMRVEKYGRRKGKTVVNMRQWSAVSEEELQELARRLGWVKIPMGALGENFRIAGIKDFTKLPPETRLVFDNGAILVAHGENKPCQRAADYLATLSDSDYEKRHVSRTFVKSALGIRGLIGWVERSGTISVGDEAEVKLPEIWEEQVYELQP